jgi:hypothetical protein
VTLLLALILAPFILLTLAFVVEVFVGLKPLPRRAMDPVGSCTAVIVVPAHDEEPILLERLQLLREAAKGQARILLVADNCTDSTAAIGRNLGVEVIERFDEERRGKGFALDFARRHLERDPPDVIVITDADCMIDGASVASLIDSCALTGRPCQATNLQKPAPAGSAAVQLSTFAFFIKNVIRQRALERLARRAHLLGTGMALPWPIFANAELATSNIVEDLKLGQELAAAGHPPLFVEQATVWSNAETDRNTLAQRQRWEGGFLHNAFSLGPAALGRSIARADIGGLWAALDTMIPPFALLILVDLAVLAGGVAVTWLARASYWPVSLLGGAVSLSAVALALAWAAGGSRFVSVASLLRAPFYLAWKLPMYLNLARRGAPKEWQRTRRE